MKPCSRATFIKSLGGGCAVLASGSLTCAAPESHDAKNTDLIRRVSVALMGMQRMNWEQGVAGQAMLELGDDERLISLARGAVMRQRDGYLATINDYMPVNDAASNGEPVLAAYELTDDPLFKEAADKMLKIVLETEHRSETGVLYHPMAPRREVWSDAFYMTPPFLAAAGEYEQAVKQINGTWQLLWNPNDKLLSHIWDDENKTFKRKAYWGVGNGWAAAGLVRVIRHLPESMQEEKEQLKQKLKLVVDGCLAHLRDDGLFHDIVDDPSSFVEVNLSQMIAYSIYRAVEAGWMERDYLDTATPMRNAAHDKVDRYGYVQDVCGVPYFDRAYVAPEGNAFFLLMEAAYRDLHQE
ncbi:MAG: glycoside hydrolase family 88 protein [candidate division KSB1 bacterium]|nr:glycoside hydrolase family 88 protein [candidate division KSB1 bacterium]